MRVLTLQQPWASLVVMGAKKWETRSWKPSNAMRHLIQMHDLLIHSSAKFDWQHRNLLTFPPFKKYLPNADALPLGAILGYVSVGRIITTEHWLKENPGYPEEQAMGNYSSGRWAWEFTKAVQWEFPIQAKGSLSLWEYDGPFFMKNAKSEVL